MYVIMEAIQVTCMYRDKCCHMDPYAKGVVTLCLHNCPTI